LSISESSRPVERQAGAIPFRLHKNRGLEILLVTSSNGEKWVFPKGGIPAGKTPMQQAATEVFEESGALGHVLAPSVGTFRMTKGGIDQEVEVFLFEVDDLSKDYPERFRRSRCWVAINEAPKMHGREEAKELFARALEMLRRLRVLSPAPSTSAEGQRLRDAI